MDIIRNYEELTHEQLLDLYGAECGIFYCPFCGEKLELTDKIMIEFLESGAVLFESCHSFWWGDM